jgi:anti-anti-sigma factor
MPPSSSQYLNSRIEQGVLVITLTVPHLRGDTLTTVVRRELNATVEKVQPKHVVLDLSPVVSLASEAFRPLLTLRRKLQENGGVLALCNLSPAVANAFQATRMISTGLRSGPPFPTYPDVASAITAVNQGEDDGGRR